jgi:hypothetical protein
MIGLFAASLACTSAWQVGRPPVTTTRFTVQANQGWSDTGIHVEAGDLVEVRYLTGVWTYWPGKVPPYDADGDPQHYVCALAQDASLCIEPLPQANKGALIARIGDQPPVYIGNQSSFRASARGTLELGMNDSNLASDLDENEGFVAVEITVTAGQ